nr:putative reverse transcriptase domain-containing protein [Tanacetum cinerariifolium]
EEVLVTIVVRKVIQETDVQRRLSKRKLEKHVVELMLLRMMSLKVRMWLLVISCIKARKYIERGCHLFLAYVTESKSKEKRMKDVPVIHDFPEVFPKELLGLPPPRQVEF